MVAFIDDIGPAQDVETVATKLGLGGQLNYPEADFGTEDLSMFVLVESANGPITGKNR